MHGTLPHEQKGRPKSHIAEASQHASSIPMCNLERPFCTSSTRFQNVPSSRGICCIAHVLHKCQVPGLVAVPLSRPLRAAVFGSGLQRAPRVAPLGRLHLCLGLLPGSACCEGAPRAREATSLCVVGCKGGSAPGCAKGTSQIAHSRSLPARIVYSYVQFGTSLLHIPPPSRCNLERPFCISGTRSQSVPFAHPSQPGAFLSACARTGWRNPPG